MLLSVAAIVSMAILRSASAQTTSSSMDPTTTTSIPVATHSVSVGADGFSYTPSTIFANINDTVEYFFYPRNHSVARAAYKQSCIPYEDTGGGRIGFWSGFKPTDIVTPDPPTFRLLINDTEPIFFYCSAPTACKNGMVGVINPNATFTFETQYAFALNSTVEYSPLQYFPEEIATTTSSSTSTNSPSPTSAPTSSSSTATPASAASKHSLSTGAIVGIAIGGLVVLVGAAFVLYCCGRRKGVGEFRRSQPPPPSHNSYQTASPGFSETTYASMPRSPMNADSFGGYNAPAYGAQAETESYRTMSPPPTDERTGMIPIQPRNFPSGAHSPRLPVSPGYQSSGYYGVHEMDMPGGLNVIKSPLAKENDAVHELAVPSRTPSAASPPADSRPFSYTDSESGYAPAQVGTLDNKF